MSAARRVGELLQDRGSALAALLRGSRRQQALDEALRAIIDGPVAAHVHVASAEDGLLTLAADTPVWGHRIRYLAPAVLEQLRGVDPSLHQVRIIVRPPRSDPPQPQAPERRAKLSQRSASLLVDVANDCNNPKLAEILRRLSALSQRNPGSDSQ